MNIDKLRDDELDKLFAGILSLKNIEECYQFFDDLCTINEILSMKQRFQVAIALDQRKTYTHIEKTTGASSSTISRVNRCLEYGSNGYRTVISRLKEEGTLP
ncbi:TrpR like protein, YerC/YecD [Actinobaculum suis]|uniref:TrpR like protein, YerC/YecD n=1 Tax=Actinobaculum suis TaxID=1657 RepID=A0A1B9BC78_9ACTO|nr:YerC/YecD family TrpR-related protein [Actinobaculum suis]OCA93276.1 hypothetical protein ACU20_01810 [Actinobaculum suis]OCA94430.1 hypothetical protein ACU21_06885 [Actinobaculum suis]VDG76700.1 TrpR like protein, YerC/YecD [Actinobaculum suis]